MSEKSVKKPSSFGRMMLIENPVFGLYLGICSTLAITTSVNNAIGMGLAVTVVLILSNMLISAVRNIVPEDIHIPVYIVIIATLVTIVELLIEAYMPELFTALGAFIDLIVVNCIILGRAEAYACKHNVRESFMDGLTMGIAYTLGLLAMAFIRQILGTGILSLSNPMTNTVIFSVQILPTGFEIPLFTSQTGAFLTFSVLAALVAAYKRKYEKAAKGVK